jgi:NifU-like protein involved in Fe-S cluster formation
MTYNELTRRYFESAAHAGELQGPEVFRGSAGNRSEGTWVQFDLQIREAVVEQVRFLAFACPHTIAVCAWLAETAVAEPALLKLPESVQALRDRFEVPVEKTGRLLIVEDAWSAAVARAAGAGVEKP